MAEFVSYSDATTFMTRIGNKFKSLSGAYIPRGNSTFANLPSVLTKAMSGYTYNVTNDFTADSRFIEADKDYPAGSNVVVVDNGTVSYSAVTPAGTENPSEEGWYEESAGVYTLSADTAVDGSKTYYEQTVTVDALLQSRSKFLVSYNDCPEIWQLWNQKGIQIESISRLNNIVQRYERGKMYDEVLISNYDTSERSGNGQLSLWDDENFKNTLPV